MGCSLMGRCVCSYNLRLLLVFPIELMVNPHEYFSFFLLWKMDGDFFPNSSIGLALRVTFFAVDEVFCVHTLGLSR